MNNTSKLTWAALTALSAVLLETGWTKVDERVTPTQGCDAVMPAGAPVGETVSENCGKTLYDIAWQKGLYLCRINYSRTSDSLFLNRVSIMNVFGDYLYSEYWDDTTAVRADLIFAGKAIEALTVIKNWGDVELPMNNVVSNLTGFEEKAWVIEQLKRWESSCNSEDFQWYKFNTQAKTTILSNSEKKAVLAAGTRFGLKPVSETLCEIKICEALDITTLRIKKELATKLANNSQTI